MQSVKLSNYFEVVQPKYSCFKVIPFASNRNYNSSDIAKVFIKMYRKISDRITYDNNKFIIQGKMKSCYLIEMSKTYIGFYFIIPVQYEIMLIDAIKRTWKNASVDRCNIPQVKCNVVYQLKYKNLDSFSLNVNRKTNDPINGFFNISDLISDNDNINIIYNFIPMSNYGWQTKCEKSFNKFKMNEPINKQGITGKNILSFLSNIIFFINDVIEHLINDKSTNENLNPFHELTNVIRENNRKLSDFSKRKMFDQPINVQILITGNNASLDNSIRCLCNAYTSISGDNELIYEKVHMKSLSLTDSDFKGIDNNICSIAETQNFIQLPDKEILEKNKAIIEYKNVQESDTPKELQSGIMCIGNNIKDNSNVFLTTDKELQFLALCIIGANRSGKTTFIGNICKDAIDNKQVNVIFDFCGNCQTSNEIKELFPNNTIEIDCSDFNNIQGLGFNELQTTSKIPFERYRSAKHQASQLITLVNSTISDTEEMRSRMERYLGSASTIVFLSNGSVKDVLMCLRDYKTRHYYIDKISDDLYQFVDEQIQSLLELDKKDGETNITAIQSILNRFSALKNNPYMDQMLKRDTSNNFNLVNMLQKPQNICIKIPESMFSTESEKDTYSLYWFCKLWSALQQRKWYIDENKLLTVNFYIDEIYQCPQLQIFLKSKLSQIPKFHAKPILTCHYLNQIPLLRKELKSANANYMILQGSDISNVYELEKELYPYTIDDLLNLKRYHSINLLKYDKGCCKCVTKLPSPIR